MSGIDKTVPNVHHINLKQKKTRKLGGDGKDKEKQVDHGKEGKRNLPSIGVP